MRGEVLLPKVALRGFTPRTYGADDIPKKIQIRDLLIPRIANLQDLQQKCRGKQLWLGVTFYLLEGTSLESRTGKDIDNLLKIVMDALPEYMDKKKMNEGLGLIFEDKDDMVFQIDAKKVLVQSESEEGIDIEIGEWRRS
ncbi:MAG: hypothetical protein JRN17_02405 [Nitrososphaerota archaeon]|nr:hypothetical protein [Nitrososphaerota archaeon]MDG7015884.1 hypothetical protein [Nitrososphaerota archaeon]